jgi:hypothetical protein
MAANLNDRLPSPEGAPLLCGGNPRRDFAGVSNGELLLMIDFMGNRNREERKENNREGFPTIEGMAEISRIGARTSLDYHLISAR